MVKEVSHTHTQTLTSAEADKVLNSYVNVDA